MFCCLWLTDWLTGGYSAVWLNPWFRVGLEQLAIHLVRKCSPSAELKVQHSAHNSLPLNITQCLSITTTKNPLMVALCQVAPFPQGYVTSLVSTPTYFTHLFSSKRDSRVLRQIFSVWETVGIMTMNMMTGGDNNLSYWASWFNIYQIQFVPEWWPDRISAGTQDILAEDFCSFPQSLRQMPR
jgi:hypothetical protein